MLINTTTAALIALVPVRLIRRTRRGCRGGLASAVLAGQAGASKASFRQGLTFLRHLGRLRRARLVGSCPSGRPRARSGPGSS